MSSDTEPVSRRKMGKIRFRIGNESLLFSKVVIWAVAVAQLIYLLLDIYRPLNRNDEGIVAYGAARILYGEIPYRDFWMTGYSPGQFYVLAGLFKLFGPSILLERIWDVLVRFAIGFLAFLIVRKLASPTMGVLAWVLITVALLPPSFYYAYVMFPALLFALLNVLLLLNYVSNRKVSLLLGTGVMLGIVTLFRHDIGIYTLISDSVVLLLVTSRETPLNDIKARLVRILRNELYLTLAALAVVAPVLLYLLLNVPVKTLWSDLIETPSQVFYKVRVLPYPPIIPSYPISTEWLSFYFPVLVFSITAGTLVLFLLRRGNNNMKDLSIVGSIALQCLGMLFFAHALIRNDEVHRMVPYVPAIMLLMIFLYSTVGSIGTPIRRMIIWGCLITVGVHYVGSAVLVEARIINSTWMAGCSSAPLVQRAGCIRLNRDQEQAVQYIKDHTARDEKIYVGLRRHDRIFVNDSIFYFLAERQSATKYHVLVPGVATTLPIQEQIVAEIKQHHIRYVVLLSEFEAFVEPNESSVSSGIFVLDEFIRQNYSPVAKMHYYTIWKER